jgi:cellulose synthase/poly-beta-1,6-N-acetylglucosamine synthase-like glycosyltransferase
MLIFVSISVLLFAAYAFLIEYYRRAWNEMPDFNLSESNIDNLSTKISIIIPARNEEKNIHHLLDSLSQQSYPKDLYQIIIVDDHSTDNTLNLINNFRPGRLNLISLQLADFSDNLTTNSYKKFAIETGINHANGDLIVTTDADCNPQKNWLRTIALFYQKTNAKFIAAPVKINADESFLSIFQTLDFITLQGITGASVFKKIHSMCNGANLAYEKKAFYEVDGFRNIDNIPSGDDMFLMHKIYKKYPEYVFFLKDKNAIVSTAPETTWKGFFNQRIRWASKADKYDDKRIFWVLLLVYIVNLLFAALLIASFWNKIYFALLFILLVLKTIIEYPFLKSVAIFFEQENLMTYFPLLQPLHIIYTIVIGWLGKFGSYQWKGRKVISDKS